jgi:dTDP-4-dehydrorhamnose reductase
MCFNSLINGANAIINPAKAVCVIGASGRLGGKIMEVLSLRGITSVYSTRREPKANEIFIRCTESSDELASTLSQHNINAIVNLAASSNGSFEEMEKVNVQFSVNAAKAAAKLKIPYIHASSTCTQVDGICPNTAPYAYTKKRAEAELAEQDHAHILRFDALIGDSSKIGIEFLASIAKFSGMNVHLDGGLRMQPTTYEAAAEATVEYISRVVSQSHDDIPKVVNIAGNPIMLKDLIHNVKTGFIHFSIPENCLQKLASKINEGALTPEFLHLASLSKQNGVKIHNNEDFQKLLSSPIPSVEELAKTVHDCMDLKTALKTIARVTQQIPMRELVTESMDIAKQSNVSLARK